MKSTQMLQGVMKTAQEALDCKNSAFASRLVVKKTPLLNRVYQARSCLITKAVEASVSASTPGKLNMQLLVLGAGLDTTYLTCADKVYLVDYQDVLDRHTNLPAHVTLVPGDLVEKEQLLAALSSSKFNFSAHTVVLVECVLGYINSEAAARMLRSITKAIPVSMIITYDPVLAYTDVVGDGFSAKMHCKFAERDAPLLGCAQSVQEYSARFTTAGYAHVNACTIYQALQLYLSREERATSVTLEPFDEFASLALLHKHYALCIGSTNSGWYQRTMACLTRQDSCNNAEDRHRRLNSRLACAELRLHSLVLRREAGNTSGAVIVRQAVEEEGAQLVAVYEQAFGVYAERYRSVQKYIKFSSKALRNVNKTYSADSGSVLFVASLGAQQDPCGCVGVKIKPPRGSEAKGTAEISHFCVQHASQRRGIGTALMVKALEHCTCVLGSGAEVCLTVLKDLEAARVLYAKLGFATIKTENLGDDCELLFMRHVTK